MPRRRDICHDLRETIVASHQSGKGYKAISKLFGVHHCRVRKIIHKWTTFKTAVNIPKSGCHSFTPSVKTAKNPKSYISASTGLS